jgi:hypothetical protein
LLIEEARAMAANPGALASVEPGERLAGLHSLGLITPASEPAYRALMASIYGPRLAGIGFDPKFGSQASDSPDRQKLRSQLVGLMAFDAHDAAVRATLKSAADAYLAGNKDALDPSFLGAAIGVAAEEGGLPMAKSLVERALSSEDADVRAAELGAAAESGHADVAKYLLGLSDKRLRSYDQLMLIGGLMSVPETRGLASAWILSNYEKMTTGNGIFLSARLPAMFNNQCGATEADRIERQLGPDVRKVNAGVLEFRRMIERVRNCGILKQAKGAEIAAALAGN